MSPRWLVACVAVVGVAMLLARGRAAPVAGLAEKARKPTPAAAGPGVAHLQGMSGCTARGCHAGEVVREEQDEFGLSDFGATSANAATVWLRHDKHADAYRVLDTPKAQRMMELLAGPGGTPKHAYQEERCLACHATPAAAAELAHFDKPQSDGFSCEACHGAAERWLGQHQTKSFHSRSDYDSSGLAWLNDPLSRAQLCVGCHVGAPADEKNGLPRRDMNHDMIAAGHPRLTFEFASYVRSMPPHWRERDRSIANSPDRKADALADWLAGQQAGLEAQLALLADRATRAKESRSAAADWRTSAPWPEFAEYDCYSCHRGLADRSPTAFEPDSGRPGGLVWNRWNWSWPLRQITARMPLEQRCRELLRTVSQPRPSPEAVLHAARSARSAVGDLGRTAAEVPDLLLSPKQAPKELLRWDDAAQLYYAWTALHAVRPDDPASGKSLLLEVQKRLQFPADKDSPTQYRPVSVSDLKAPEPDAKR